MRHPPAITTESRRDRLAHRLHLAPSAAAHDPITVADSLVGLHSSDPASVVLGTSARMGEGGNALTTLDAALYLDRSLLRLLGMRRTVFVAPLELAATIQSACTNALVPGERRKLEALLAASGIAADPGPWLDRVMGSTLEALEHRGEAIASDLTADVPELALQIRLATDKPYAGQVGVSTRVLFLLAAQGLIVRARPRGSWISSQYRWARTERWLGTPLGETSQTIARVELVRRWLASYGPGTTTDLAWWTGWTKRDVTAALTALAATDVTLEGGESGWVLPSDLGSPPAAEPWAALLPGLDPAIMGWKEREWVLGDHRAAVFDNTGNVGPTAWWCGRVVGGWAQRKAGEVVVRVLEDVGAEATAAIAAKAQQLQELLGDTRVTPRFRTPLERSLT